MADNLQVSAKISEEKSVNILTLSVVRRDGAITPFKSDKISNAIKKAFLAQTKIRNDKNKEKEQQDGIHKTVEALTHKVVSALTRRIADGDMIHIEDIQDQVELALMRDEHHKVARAYVLYREQRAASRYHTKKLKEQVGATPDRDFLAQDFDSQSESNSDNSFDEGKRGEDGANYAGVVINAEKPDDGWLDDDFDN